MISAVQTRYWWSDQKSQPLPRELVLIGWPKPPGLENGPPTARPHTGLAAPAAGNDNRPRAPKPS
jgi:hypothetical protein